MYGLIRMTEVFEQKGAGNSERKYLWGMGGCSSNKRTGILYTFCCHEFVTQSLQHLL